MTYANRMWPEAVMQRADEGYDAGGMQTLATMARKPETIAAVNKAREISSKDRYSALNRNVAKDETEQEHKAVVAVWKTMPGYTCYMDALTITARL
jgi:hypothetical protein